MEYFLLNAKLGRDWDPLDGPVSEYPLTEEEFVFLSNTRDFLQGNYNGNGIENINTFLESRQLYLEFMNRETRQQLTHADFPIIREYYFGTRVFPIPTLRTRYENMIFDFLVRIEDGDTDHLSQDFLNSI